MGRSGLNIDLHHLFLFESVAQLMGIEDIPDTWLDTYFGYLEKAATYEITEMGENLLGLAGECLEGLGD